MDKPRLLECLKLNPENLIYFSALRIIAWGRSLHFSCYAQSPDGTKHQFSLVFDDCRDMRWQAYSHIELDENVQFPLTELVNFRMGRDQQRSPCQMLTEHFGLTLFYGEMKILLDDS